jgi:hypothetical protein
MACVTEPTTIDFCRRRGDTYTITFTVTDAAGDPIDIQGYSFLLTVDPSPDPPDDTNNLFQIAGVIVEAGDGVFSMTPTLADSDQEPDTYYYDLQQTDAASAIRTIAAGQWTVVQDITK